MTDLFLAPPPRLRSASLSVFLTIFLLGSVGCGTTKFLTVRHVPRSPLEGPLQLVSYQGPRPSERTELLLRRYALVDAQKNQPEEVLRHLFEEMRADATPEKVYAYAELSYLSAKRSEASRKVGLALDHYSAAVAHAYMYLFSSAFDSFRNPYDPQFRQACDLYNGSLEGVLRLANKRGALKPGRAEIITTGQQQYHVNIVVKGPWSADEIERLEFVSDYEVQGGLKNQYHTYGLGVPLIAVRKGSDATVRTAEKYYPPGLSFATTAFLRVMPPGDSQEDSGKRECVLELHDPLASSNITVNGRTAPLETDLTIPLAYFLDSPKFKEKDISTVGLLYPEKTAAVEGLYMLEPYDPRRIPVVMVHGLWSSPLTWMEMFNDLRAFPEVREKYQFWFYLYPTGCPFWESAAHMREVLAQARRDIDPYGQSPNMQRMVLAGHSMGGLLSYMQTVESGDDFWRLVSNKPFMDLKAEPETKDKLAQVFYFHPDPGVRRVITMGTPFHGSDFINSTARWAGQKLIVLPEMMKQLTNKVTRDNPDFFQNTALLTTSTSIDSLSPESPIFKVLCTAQRSPLVKYHTIIGVIPQTSFVSGIVASGDGLVAYKSAHLDNVASEFIVPAEHLTVHRHPKSTLEVRRILLEHWEDSWSMASLPSGPTQTAVENQPIFPAP